LILQKFTTINYLQRLELAPGVSCYFTSMSKLRNKINDVWFNDLMICYTERKIFRSLVDIDIIWTFTAKRSRKEHLHHNFIYHIIGRLYFFSLISNCTFVDKM